MRREAIALAAALLLLLPAALGRPVDERGRDEPRVERGTMVLLLKWSKENVGISNFSREGTTPLEALASFPRETVSVIHAWWKDPNAKLPEGAGERAQESIVRYCVLHNAQVYERQARALGADLHRLAPGARVARGPDGLGTVFVQGVPLDAFSTVASLPYVSNVGWADPAYSVDRAKYDRTYSR